MFLLCFGPEPMLIKGLKAMGCFHAKAKVHLPWEPEIHFLEQTLFGLLTLFLAIMGPIPISPLMFAPWLYAPLVQG